MKLEDITVVIMPEAQSVWGGAKADASAQKRHSEFRFTLEMIYR